MVDTTEEKNAERHGEGSDSSAVVRFRLFCNHDWNLLSETVTESKYEIAMRAAKGSGVSNIKLPWQLCDAERKHIQTFCCEKCGKLKRFVEGI